MVELENSESCRIYRVRDILKTSLPWLHVVGPYLAGLAVTVSRICEYNKASEDIIYLYNKHETPPYALNL